jgi:hypothetical protein
MGARRISPFRSVEASNFGGDDDPLNPPAHHVHNYVFNGCITAAGKIWKRIMLYRILDLQTRRGSLKEQKTRKGESSEE